MLQRLCMRVKHASLFKADWLFARPYCSFRPWQYSLRLYQRSWWSSNMKNSSSLLFGMNISQVFQRTISSLKIQHLAQGQTSARTAFNQSSPAILRREKPMGEFPRQMPSHISQFQLRCHNAISPARRLVPQTYTLTAKTLIPRFPRSLWCWC